YPTIVIGWHWGSDSGKAVTHRDSSITLPCRFHQEPENDDPARIRIKWTKVTDVLQFQDVFVALGRRQRVFGPYRGRVFLEQAGPADASVIIQNVTLEDYGRYECQEHWNIVSHFSH
uniref:Ig-like domain-containing protein n=1 Tax=Mola mola TaxID=94237 RepID=A0A3Q3VJW8_MOLML